MLAKILTCAIVGLEGAIVEVEVDISPGQFGLTLVGLPDASVQEAKERAQRAPGRHPQLRLRLSLPADHGEPRPG